MVQTGSMSLLKRRRAIIVHFDGSCSPVNPGGTVQYGWHGTGPHKAEEGYGVAFSGGESATNNVAEYTALAAALCHLLGSNSSNVDPENPKTIILRGDSEIAVRQFNGDWRVNHSNLKPIAAIVHLMKDQLTQLGYDVRAEWIHGDKNVRADKLSRRALNELMLDRQPLTKKLGKEYYE